MKFHSPATMLRTALTALAFGALAPVLPAAPPATPLAFEGQVITNIRLPIQRHENGRVKELFRADQASVGKDGTYHAAGNVRVIAYDENGEQEGEARADRAAYNPEKNTAVCEGPVFFSLDKKGVTLSGTNLTWMSELFLVRIETNAVLRLHRTGSTVEALEKP